MNISNGFLVKNQLIIFLIALFIAPLSGLGTDIYVPSLPAITHHFNVDESLVQLTVSLYMLGMGISQVIGGFITDTFGRKRPILVSLSIYFLTCLFIPIVHSIHQLLFFRLIQGITMAIAIVPNRSIVPDLFSGKQLIARFNYMTTAWAIGPIIAPVIGGYLQTFFGWHASFYFLAIYSGIGFVLVLLFLPETSHHRHPPSIGEFTKRILRMLTTPQYVSGVITNGFLYSINVIFAVVSPFIIQTVFHYSAVQFGHLILLTGGAWFVGTVVSRLLIHVPIDKKALISLTSMQVISVLMLIYSLLMPMSVLSLIIPVLLMSGCAGLVFPNNFARAVSLFPQNTGSANALAGSLVYSTVSLCSALSLNLGFHSMVPLSLAYVALVFVCLTVTIAGLQKIPRT